jgi:hypothetical protein
MCNQPAYRKRLEGIVHIIERKHRLEVRVRSVGDTIAATTAATAHKAASASAASGSRSVAPSPGGPQGFSDAHGNNSNSPHNAEFACYKGKAYASIEPINCIQHIMKLLN